MLFKFSYKLFGYTAPHSHYIISSIEITFLIDILDTDFCKFLGDYAYLRHSLFAED